MRFLAFCPLGLRKAAIARSQLAIQTWFALAMFITQETFDEVVKENMKDFGMDRQSAAEDAVGQFGAQGVCTSFHYRSFLWCCSPLSSLPDARS